MKFIKRILIVFMALSVFFTPVIANADDSVPEKTRILLLGNSLFYYNSMDTVVFPEFCKAAGENVEVTSITESGTTIYRMASEKTEIGKKVLAALTENTYDYVILNPSRRVTPFEYSVYHAEKAAAIYLNSLINAMGAKTLLVAQPGLATGDIPVYLMSDSGLSSTTEYSLPMDRNTHRIYVENMCNDFAKDMVNVSIVKVGEAAETILEAFPDFNSLYKSDNRHPSTRGSYLQAACYYAAVFGKSPVGVNYVYSLFTCNAVTVQRAAEVAVLGADKSILKTETGTRTLTAQLTSNTSACLKWTEPKTAIRYNIYRKTGSGSYNLIGSTVGNELSYTDNTLTGGHTYYYKIKAVHKVGDVEFESDYSSESTVATLATPKLSSVTLQSKKTAVIKFKSVSNAKKYRIYRKKQGASKFTLIGSTTALSYTDKKLKLGNTYVYAVAAVGSSSKILSNLSTEKSVLSIATPKVQLTAKKSQVVVNITSVKYAKRYAVYIKKSGSKSYKLLKTTSKLKVTAKKLSSKTKYSIKVVSYKGTLSTNTSSVPKIISVTTK